MKKFSSFLKMLKKIISFLSFLVVFFCFEFSPLVSDLVLGQFVTEKSSLGEAELPQKNAQNFLKTSEFIIFLLAILFVVSIFGFIYAGIKMILSGGNLSTFKEGQKVGLASAIAFGFSILGFLIVNVIKHYF